MGRYPPTPYPITGPVRVELLVSTRRMDIDALIKPVLDCIERSGAIRNDGQVVDLHVRKEGLPPGRTNGANCKLALRVETADE
jgi:Holliday junction resolvase RusA-like endonuclease